MRTCWPGLVLAVTVFGASLAGSSRTVGFAFDDGVYVAAAQSLAEGHGYALPDRVGDRSVPLFPAGYPLVAAACWRVFRSPAAALVALAALSAACMGAAALLWWRVLAPDAGRATAALLVAVPALSYASLTAGELRAADAPYALLVAVAAVLWRPSESSRSARWALLLVAALAPVLRTAGAVLTLAVALLLMARRQRLLAAGAIVLAAAVVALSGALWPVGLSYGDVVRSAWAPGGAGPAILRANLAADVWTSLVSFVVPGLMYSGALQALIHRGAALGAGYAVAVAAASLAVVVGGWRRLRAGRWQVGDLALVGALSLVLVVPIAMIPRLLVGVGPVITLWAWEGVTMGRAPRRMPVLIVLGLSLVATAFEAAGHVRRQPRILAERAAAYAHAGTAARAWLGPRGLITTEFPETLWFETGLRSVSLTTPIENGLAAESGLDAARRRAAPITRGCLLDTRTYPVSAALHEEYVERPGAERLRGLDERWVRAVCWPDQYSSGSPTARPSRAD